MKSISSSIKKFFQRNFGKIILILFILVAGSFTYGLYYLFNRPPDPLVEAKIQAETQSVDIKFNTKTIEGTKNLKNYNVPLDPNVSGKNPFLTY